MDEYSKVSETDPLIDRNEDDDNDDEEEEVVNPSNPQRPVLQEKIFL